MEFKTKEMKVVRFLFFSHKFRNIGFFLKFQYLKLRKWLAILFKKRKNLDLVSFNYFKNWHSDRSFLIVDIQCRNMIWFKIDNYKSIFYNQPIIVDLITIKADHFDIEIFGFSQKQTLRVDLRKEIKIYSESFKAKLTNLNDFRVSQHKVLIKIEKPLFTAILPKLQLDKITVNEEEIVVNIQEISINTNNVKLNHNLFKIHDYL